VGTTGLIFAAIAIAWLAYLVPHFVRRRDGEPDLESETEHRADPFSDSVRILRNGTAPLLDQDLAELREFEVSTPVTRRAAVADLRRLERVAASRRRRVLSALFAILCAVISVCSMGWLPWWSVAVPGGLVLLFVVVSRVSVRAMRRDLDARYVAICHGSDEKTVMISRKDAAESKDKKKKAKKTKDATEAEGKPGLWDPLPITVPTYVSKPLAPRTVRTIDLSGPDVTSSGRQTVPVTADAPAEAPVEVVSVDEQDGGSKVASA
jgi:hypothetical protein